MEAPTYIDSKFVKTYTRRPFDDGDELVYVLTWADGSVTEQHTIPNDWHAIYVRCVDERHDANLAKMAAEHAAGFVGVPPVMAKVA